MKRVKFILILITALVFLTTAAVFAVSSSDINGGKVVPSGWCSVHGYAPRQITINGSMVCSLCE